MNEHHDLSLYSNRRLDQINTLDFSKLYDWALDYHTNGPVPVPAFKRFWILEYQIPQAVAYRGREPANYAEGLASLVINAFIFAAALRLPVFSHLQHKAVNEVPKTTFDAMRTLLLLGNSWQMIHYQQAASERHRSRYKEDKLAKNVAGLIEAFCSFMPSGYEGPAIEDTTRVLTQDIVLKPNAK